MPERSEGREDASPTLDALYGYVYGIVLDDSGSMDYYDSAVEAYEDARRWDLPVVKVTTEPVECICYSHADPRCEIHGY